MRKVLYLGLDPSRFECDGDLVHCPVIKTVNRPREEIEWALSDALEFTHLIFSSQNGVRYFFDAVPELGSIEIFCVGEATAGAVRDRGYECQVAQKERQEGVIDLLRPLDLNGAYVGVPCAVGARGTLGYYLARQDVRHQIIPLYTTVPREVDIPSLDHVDELVFTSPSCVDAFFAKRRPTHQTLRAIGPVTKERLNRYL
ncbi:MAG: hypothetical protein SP1CHLAM54_00630 [Chlamydiia bacterium]|nr:hypothetical protein [Chlamydiia bacterium]MCH9614985.1 hypothetical protein [Chlamydiia bacterium]MCH9629965.1 hypothetical protein [Chlamydiia bacterium]